MIVVLAHKGTLLSVSLCRYGFGCISDKLCWRLGTAVKVSGKMGCIAAGIGAVFIIYF